MNRLIISRSLLVDVRALARIFGQEGNSIREIWNR